MRSEEPRAAACEVELLAHAHQTPSAMFGSTEVSPNWRHQTLSSRSPAHIAKLTRSSAAEFTKKICNSTRKPAIVKDDERTRQITRFICPYCGSTLLKRPVRPP